MKTLITAIALSFSFALGTTYASNSSGPTDTLETSNNIGPQSTNTISGITLLESAVCESIEAHDPVLPGSIFSKELGKVWVYSKFSMDKEVNSTVKHIYYFKGEKIGEVELKVKGPGFRTNSYKTITANMNGDWRVEITAEDDQVFETLEFTISN